MTERSNRRPPSVVASFVAYIQNGEEKWIPCEFKRGMWIHMQPSSKGPHRVSKRKRHNIKNHWKGRIVSLKILDGQKLVQVQHVYTKKDMKLQLDTQGAISGGNCNLFSFMFSIFIFILNL